MTVALKSAVRAMSHPQTLQTVKQRSVRRAHTLTKAGEEIQKPDSELFGTPCGAPYYCKLIEFKKNAVKSKMVTMARDVLCPCSLRLRAWELESL